MVESRNSSVNPRNLILVFAVFAAAVVLAGYFGGFSGRGSISTISSVSELSIARDKAAALYGRGEYKAAVPALEGWLIKNENDARSRSLLASAYWQTGRKAKAYEQYKALLKRDPGNAETLYLLSLCAKDLKKPKEELAYMEKAAKAKPDSVQFQSYLAGLHRDRRHYATALKIWKRLLAATPPEQLDQAEIYAEIASIYKAAGSPEDAREAVDSGLALAPDNARLKELEGTLD